MALASDRVHWAGEAIAHIVVSFGFAGEHVAISIETRKEVGEAYSSLAGFFRRYELIYVVGDERDLIRVRTNYREPREQVYLYRTRESPDSARRLFLEYVDKINQLREQPESTTRSPPPARPTSGGSCGPSRASCRSTGGCC